VQGPDLRELQRVGAEIEEILTPVEGTRAVFAERVSQGFYVNITVNRDAAARYGLTVDDVQLAITSGIGGEDIATTVQGRERFPINVRYLQDYRNDLDGLKSVLLMTPSGAQIPLGEVASVELAPGPSMIRDEDARLTGYVYIDLATSDYGNYAACARSETAVTSRIHPQVVGRVRVSAAGTEAAVLHHADRIRRDLRPSIHALPLGYRSCGADLSVSLCDDRRPGSSVPDGIQLQCRGLGWIYRALRHRCGDRRGDDNLSP
jgi:multidrug efflux pump subunit AcrB